MQSTRFDARSGAPVRSASRRRKLWIGAACVTASVVASIGPVGASPPQDDPASGHRSNMGLCSPFLGQAGVRPLVNQLVRDFGAFLPDGPYDNVGELYRIRAQQKPTASAAEECTARPGL
jgi:hypothetical protein